MIWTRPESRMQNPDSLLLIPQQTMPMGVHSAVQALQQQTTVLQQQA